MSKVTEYTALTPVLSTDIVYVVSDPGSSPVSKKATVADVLAAGSYAKTYTSAYASPPGSPASGDIWLPTDSFYTCLRYSGSVWAPFIGGRQATLPVSGDFAWINQGAASVDDSKGATILLGVAGTGNSLRIRKKAKAAAYTITAAFMPHNVKGSVYNASGLLFRQSSDGKCQTLSIQSYSDGFNLISQKFSDATTYSAEYLRLIIQDAPIYWLRIADNSTNRICSWSPDGLTWIQVHSVGRTDYLTADEVGFFCDSNNVTYPSGMTLLSWVEA